MSGLTEMSEAYSLQPALKVRCSDWFQNWTAYEIIYTNIEIMSDSGLHYV